MAGDMADDLESRYWDEKMTRDMVARAIARDCKRPGCLCDRQFGDALVEVDDEEAEYRCRACGKGAFA